MNCNELRDEYELYVLGLAEEPELSEIRSHLDRHCEVCMAQIRNARELMALFGTGTPAAAPSPKLRRRILASVGVMPGGFGWAPAFAGVAALCLCAALYYAGRQRQYFGEAQVLREQARTQAIEITQLNEAFAILKGADTTVSSFGDKQPKPKGQVYVNPNRGVLLIASNLPAAPAGKAYEMWVIPKGASPVRAGMFRPNPDGTAMHLQGGLLNLANAAAIAVTLEVEAGVDAPTNTPLIVAPMPQGLQ